MTIGERIKSARLKNNLKQTDLAIACKISKQTLHKYENNIVTNIPLDKIEKIAFSLNTTPAYLMGWEDKKEPSAEDEGLNHFLKLTERLSDENYQKLIDYMELLLNSQKSNEHHDE